MERVCVTYRINEDELKNVLGPYLDLYRYSLYFVYRKGIYNRFRKGVTTNRLAKFSGPKEGIFTLTVFDSDLEKVIDEFMGRDSPSDYPQSPRSSNSGV